MNIRQATDAASWDAFLCSRRFRPFLQSWTMGEVYGDLGQEPLRWEITEGSAVTGICFGHIVPARRGKHLVIPYGPLLLKNDDLKPLIEEIRDQAARRNCAFIRISPFWPESTPLPLDQSEAKPSPLHLLAEHIWYLPLKEKDPWETDEPSSARTEESLQKDMRSTARNLIRRALKEGVEITASDDPIRDLPGFLALHEETRKRHGFVPYGEAFFRAQVKRFAASGSAILYLARYKGEVIASSIHIKFGNETSYHHGASTHKYKNIPASYLLQWTAIQDALKRGDRIYNFWGISPEGLLRHPFAGVRTFKTGFGGKLLPLVHCFDIPLSPRYPLVRVIEQIRKWRRGF